MYPAARRGMWAAGLTALVLFGLAARPVRAQEITADNWTETTGFKPDLSVFSGMRRDPIVRSVGQTLDKIWTAASLTPDSKLKPAPAPAES